MLSMRNPGAEASLHGAVYLPDAETPSMEDLIGGAGKFQPTGGVLQELRFHFVGNDDVRLLCLQDTGTFDLKIGMEGHFLLTEWNGVSYGAIGRWRAANILEIELRNTRLVSGHRFLFRFQGQKLFLTADSTVPLAGGLADPLFRERTFTLREGEASLKTKMYWEQ